MISKMVKLYLNLLEMTRIYYSAKSKNYLYREIIIISSIFKRGGKMTLEQAILYVILGIVLAIVYSIRILVLLERRIARMDENLVRITNRIISEEKKIESMLKRKKKR